MCHVDTEHLPVLGPRPLVFNRPAQGNIVLLYLQQVAVEPYVNISCVQEFWWRDEHSLLTVFDLCSCHTSLWYGWNCEVTLY